MLREIAESLQESARLEGVVRSRTAEGRSQAWVLGIAPLALLVILEFIDPNWSAPLWNDPFGWGLLGAAAVLEGIGLVLIRKIMNVET